MTDRTITFEWLAETGSGNALGEVVNAINAASDQDQVTWIVLGTSGKRIAKITPVDEIPDDILKEVQDRLTADGAAWRQEQGLDRTRLDRDLLLQSIARQVEEIHRSLGLERDEEGGLVAVAFEAGPLSQGKFTPSGPVTIQLLVDVLSLAGVQVSMGAMAAWNYSQRVDAYDWAIRDHLAASDNSVARVERPAFIIPAGGSS